MEGWNGMEDTGKIAKAVLGMLWSVFLYIMSYAILSVVLSSFHADACVVQMLSSTFVIYHSWKRDSKKHRDYFKECGFKTFSMEKQDALVLAALGFGLNCAVGGLINLIPFAWETGESYRRMAAAPVEGVKPALAFFVIAFCAPVVEETFFRGTLLRKLSQTLNPLSALALVSLVFGALHGQIIWAIYASVLGLVLGMTWLLTKSIYPSILVHMSFNLVSGIPMLLKPSWLIYRITYGNKLFLAVMAAGGTYLVIRILTRYYFPKFMESGELFPGIEKETAQETKEA